MVEMKAKFSNWRRSFTFGFCNCIGKRRQIERMTSRSNGRLAEALDAHHARARDDSLQRHERSAPASRAALAHSFPVVRRVEVGRPEGPGAALPRPHGINLACAAFAVEEDAVAAGKLDETLALPHAAHVAIFELLDLDADGRRQRGDLILVHPHVTGLARAALAALGTSETQTGMVPRLLRHCC
jgi:hypothetical protein